MHLPPNGFVKNQIEKGRLKMAVNFIYMTAGNKAEAQKIGKALVESRLAACVNILDNMQSIYRWEEKLQEDSEVVLIAKTTDTRVPQLIDKVKSLHSYDCPCIVSLPVSGGYPPFLDWIQSEVND
jgi:periplasmic divalent cation tolerance protein